MALTKEQISIRMSILSREYEYYKKLGDSIADIAAEKIQGEIFGLQWVIDHWESGYDDNAQS